MPGHWMDAGGDSLSYSGSGATSGANVTSGGAVKPQLKTPSVSAAGPKLNTTPQPIQPATTIKPPATAATTPTAAAPATPTSPPQSLFERGMQATSNASTALQDVSNKTYLGAGAGWLARQGYRMAVPAVNAASGIPSAAQAAPAGWRAGSAAQKALSPAGRIGQGLKATVGNLSGLSALQAPKFGAPVTLGSRVMGVAGKLNAGSNAAYGAYALGDVARSGYNLATGQESLGGIQSDAMGRGYMDNVNHNLARPGQAVIALGDSAIDTAINTPAQAIRGYGLDRQINNRQNQQSQTTQQAMQAGTANKQQLSDAGTSLQREQQSQISARRYRPWLWSL